MNQQTNERNERSNKQATETLGAIKKKLTHQKLKEPRPRSQNIYNDKNLADKKKW